MNETYLESLLITEEDWIATERFSFFHRKKKPIEESPVEKKLVSRPKESPEEEKEREEVLSKLSQRIRAVSQKMLIRLKKPIGYTIADKDDYHNDSPNGDWWISAIEYDISPIAKKLNINTRDELRLSAEDPKLKAAGIISLDKMCQLLKAAIGEDSMLKRFSLSVDYGGDWDGGPIGVYYRYKKESNREV